MYLIPNEAVPDFRRRLESRGDAVLGTEEQILTGGDFNAELLNASSRLPREPDLKNGVTFALESLVLSVNGW